MGYAIFKKDFTEGIAGLVLLAAGAIVNWDMNVRENRLYSPDDDAQAILLLTALFGGVLIGSTSLGLERARGTLGYLLHRGVSVGSVFRQKAAAALLWAWLLTISAPTVFFLKAVMRGDGGLIDVDRVVEFFVISLWAGPAVAISMWQASLARNGMNGWLRACLCIGAVGGTLVWFSAARELWPVGLALPVFGVTCAVLTVGGLLLARRGFERLASDPGTSAPGEAGFGTALLALGLFPIVGLWLEMGRDSLASDWSSLRGREVVVRDAQGNLGLFDAYGREGRIRDAEHRTLAISKEATYPGTYALPAGWSGIDYSRPQGPSHGLQRHPYSRGPFSPSEVLFLSSYSSVHSARGGEGWFRVGEEYLSWLLVYVEPERRFYVVQENYGSVVSPTYKEGAIEAPADWPAGSQRIALGPEEGFGPGTQYFLTGSASDILVGGDVFPDVIVAQPEPPALFRVRVQDFDQAVQPLELPDGEVFARVLDRDDADWAALHSRRTQGNAPPLVVEARSGKRFALDLNQPAGTPFKEYELPLAPPQRDELIWIDDDPFAPVVRVPGSDLDLALGRSTLPSPRRLAGAHLITLLQAPLVTLTSQFVAIEPGQRKAFLWSGVLDWNTANGRRTWLVALHWALYAWIAWLARHQATPRTRTFWTLVIVGLGPIGLLLWGFNARWHKPDLESAAPPEPLIVSRVSTAPLAASV